jgi:hypothetical protein
VLIEIEVTLARRSAEGIVRCLDFSNEEPLTTNLPVTFGPNTENEMCYNFVTAWPANALSHAAGSDHCLP